MNSICPQPNKGSKSSSTTAAVLGVSGVIRLDCSIMFLPVYTTKHHKYPVLDLRSSKVFILNSEAFSGRYCLIDRHPFQSVKLHQWQCSGLVDREFETLFQTTYHRINFEQYGRSLICWSALVVYEMQKIYKSTQIFLY